MKNLTAHEFAKVLLSLPDVPLVTTDGEYGYPVAVTKMPSTHMADRHEMEMLWLDGQRMRIRI